MLVSVKRKKFVGTQERRYQPTRSKTFINRPQTAKREKEELTIKLIGLPHNRTESLHRSNHREYLRFGETYNIKIRQVSCLLISYNITIS